MMNKNVPCPVCPYKLGMVKTLVNPCPHCKQNNYSFYREITHQQGNLSDIKTKKETN